MIGGSDLLKGTVEIAGLGVGGKDIMYRYQLEKSLPYAMIEDLH